MAFPAVDTKVSLLAVVKSHSPLREELSTAHLAKAPLGTRVPRWAEGMLKEPEHSSLLYSHRLTPLQTSGARQQVPPQTQDTVDESHSCVPLLSLP